MTTQTNINDSAESSVDNSNLGEDIDNPLAAGVDGDIDDDSEGGDNVDEHVDDVASIDKIGNNNGTGQKVTVKPKSPDEIAAVNLELAKLAVIAAEKRVVITGIQRVIADTLNAVMGSESDEGNQLLDLFSSLDGNTQFNLIADITDMEFRSGQLLTPNAESTKAVKSESNSNGESSTKTWFVSVTKDGTTTEIPMRGTQTNDKKLFDDVLHDIYNIDGDVTMGGKSTSAKKQILDDLGFSYETS